MIRIAIALSLWLVTAGAFAGPAEAEAHYRRGANLYRNGSYREAAAAFERAFAENALPKYVYNQAQAERLAGDCASAVATYRRFLELAPPPDQRKQAEDNMAACETQLPPKEPVIEEPPVEPAPEPPRQPPKVEPRAVPAPAPKPTVTPQPVEEPSAIADPLGGVLLGTGIVALGVGGGVLGWSFVVEADAEDPATQSGRSYDEHVAALERAETGRIAAIVVMAAGGALVGAAAIRYTVVARTQVSLLPGGLRIEHAF